jgi:hypothetical protein
VRDVSPALWYDDPPAAARALPYLMIAIGAIQSPSFGDKPCPDIAQVTDWLDHELSCVKIYISK